MLDIEVGTSVEDLAAMEGLVIDPARHQVLPDGDYIKGARRHTGLDVLFIYRHRETGNFVLAGWTIKGKMCIELMSWAGEHLLQGAPSYQEIAHRTRPVEEQRRERIAQIRAVREKERAGMKVSEQARDEQVKRARARGDIKGAASLLMSPYTAREESPKEFDATIDKMTEASYHATPKISTRGLELPSSS